MKLDLGNPDWRTHAAARPRSVASDAPVAACAFSRDGKTVAFALGDGRVRLLPADVKEAAAGAAEPVHKGAVLSLIADPVGDGFISGGDDGRLLRIGPDGSATEIANHKGKWIDKLAAHRSNGTFAASVGKMALVVDKAGEVREFGPHAEHGGGDRLQQGRQPHRRRALRRHHGVEHRPGHPAAAHASPGRGSHVALKWSTDGKFIATGTQENDIHVWRIAQASDMRMAGLSRQGEVARRGRPMRAGSTPPRSRCSPPGRSPARAPKASRRLQFGDEGAGLLTVVAAHPAAEFVAGGYDSGELQLGDIKTRRSVVLKMADGSAVSCLAWSPDGFRLAAGNDNGDMLVIDLRR